MPYALGPVLDGVANPDPVLYAFVPAVDEHVYAAVQPFEVIHYSGAFHEVGHHRVDARPIGAARTDVAPYVVPDVTLHSVMLRPMLAVTVVFAAVVAFCAAFTDHEVRSS